MKRNLSVRIDDYKLEKQDDFYRLKYKWLDSAMEIVNEVLRKFGTTTTLVVNGREGTSG